MFMFIEKSYLPDLRFLVDCLVKSALIEAKHNNDNNNNNNILIRDVPQILDLKFQVLLEFPIRLTSTHDP